jgi:hypothetical protein
MAKAVKRNRAPIQKVDYTAVENGIYIDEVSFGEIHLMEQTFSNEACVDEFVYEGKLHNGEVKFITGEKLATQIPGMNGYNHGYTLEGIAQEIFKVENALDIYSTDEGRTFNYTKTDSKLVFVGDKKKEYVIYVRFYDNCYGDENNRWAVIFAEEK